MASTRTTTPTPSSPSGDSTAPSTPPSTVSSIQDASEPPQGCTSLLCPIDHPHDRGVYLDSCRVALSHDSRRIFAPSVPPPDIVAAYERCLRNDGTRTDEELWVTFHELHVEPLLDDTDAVWVSPMPTRPQDDDSMIDERADPGSVKAGGAAGRCNHPFELYNPPKKVWKAHRNLVMGVGDSGDQELVDAYAARNAYCGKGFGQYQSMSRRFAVRRPGYSPGLAKERRMNKELEFRQSKS